MVDNDLGYRFTNEIYATKKEVANTLKVTLIDKFIGIKLSEQKEFKNISKYSSFKLDSGKGLSLPE